MGSDGIFFNEYLSGEYTMSIVPPNEGLLYLLLLLNHSAWEYQQRKPTHVSTQSCKISEFLGCFPLFFLQTSQPALAQILCILDSRLTVFWTVEWHHCLEASSEGVSLVRSTHLRRLGTRLKVQRLCFAAGLGTKSLLFLQQVLH